MANSKQKKQKIDKFQLIADQLLALMAQGNVPWQCGWALTRYRNAATGHEYRGLNPVLAEISLMTRGYHSTLFIGFAQAKALNLKMIKGSKATWLRFAKVYKKEEIDPTTGETVEKSYFTGGWQCVYSLDCFTDEEADIKIADLMARYQVKRNTQPRIDVAEALVSAQQAEIVTGGNRACYIPSLDKIHMPPYESFSSPESYYATVIHELAHRTGHSSRLNRNLSMDAEEYAFEELVADMTAAFVCGELNLSAKLENHASYIGGWMKRIQADNKAFFKASALARDAANLLLENAGIQGQELHSS